MACYKSVPFDADDLANQVDVFSTYLTFSDLRSSYDRQVKWRAKLGRVASAEYESDFDAFVALRNWVLNFKNGHFRYRGPVCYGGFVVPFIPLSFGSSLQNASPLDFYNRGFSGHAKQIIYIEDAPFFPEDYLAATGIDANDFVGQRVVSINGQEPIAFFRRFARRIQLDRDPGVNLNGILEFGAFSIRSGPSSPFPRRRAVKFVFEDRQGRQTRVRMPWVFVQSQPRGLSPFPAPSSSEEFLAACAATNPNFPPASAQASTNMPAAVEGPWAPLQSSSFEVKPDLSKSMVSKIRRRGRRQRAFEEVPERRRNRDIREIVPLTNGARVVEFKDHTTAIQLQNNFVDDWREQVRAGAAYACENSRNLIIDVRSNFGGRGDLVE
ncbi:MAG: hypothetical protein AAFV29_10950, partial [Myxococcota bacterium]